MHKNIDFTVHSSFNWICIQILHFVYVQIYSVVKFSMTHSLFKLHWLKTRFTTGSFRFSNKFFSSIITRFGTILSAAIWISDAWSALLASGKIVVCIFRSQFALALLLWMHWSLIFLVSLFVCVPRYCQGLSKCLSHPDCDGSDVLCCQVLRYSDVLC